MQNPNISLIDAIKQMGPIRFRQIMINHPNITSMFDPEGSSLSAEEAWAAFPDDPPHSWVMERQRFLHEVIDRNLADLFAAGFETTDDVVASFQKSLDEVIAYAAEKSPRDYQGEENSAFKDGCTYQLMTVMMAVKDLSPDAVAIEALTADKADWALIAPERIDFMAKNRESQRAIRKNLVTRLSVGLHSLCAIAAGR